MKVLLDADTLAAALLGRLPVVMRLAGCRPADVAVSRFSLVQVEAGLRGQPRALACHGGRFEAFREALQVLDFGAAEGEQAVRLAVQLQLAGETLAPSDLIEAATALAHRCTLVTARPQAWRWVSGLPVENWLLPASA